MQEETLYIYQDENYYIHHTRTENPDPGQSSFRSHCHNNMYEIYYFFSGTADFVVEGSIHPLQRGTLIVTARGQAHHILLRGSEPAYERIALLFSQKALPSGFARAVEAVQKGINVFPLSQREQIWLEESFRLIENRREAEEPVPPIQAVVVGVWAKLSSLIADLPPAPPDNDDLVREIICFIQQNLTSDWNLDTLAKALYRSKAYLNRRFKGVMGCSIWEYALQKRIFSAQQQLYLSRSIAQAYQQSGFQDYSVFYRQYRKYIGLSPSEDLREWTSTRTGNKNGRPRLAPAAPSKKPK